MSKAASCSPRKPKAELVAAALLALTWDQAEEGLGAKASRSQLPRGLRLAGTEQAALRLAFF